MVGDHDAGGAGFESFAGSVDGHDAFDDKGLSCIFDHLREFLYGFAACRRLEVLQEGKAGSIDVHGDRKAA